LLQIGANEITVAEICGEDSFLGEVALANNLHYKTWVLNDPERVFVTMYMWKCKYYLLMIKIVVEFQLTIFHYDHHHVLFQLC
jgi:hypothetical protein